MTPSVPQSQPPGASVLVPGRSGAVLLLSMRRLANLVAFCAQYEFEDVISEVTGADRVDAADTRALELSRRAYKLLRLGTRSRNLARALAPRPSTVRLQRDYELFIPVFNYTHELYALRAVPDWRARCRVAACFITEAWAHLLPGYLLELLSEFDHIFIGTRHCVAQVARLTGRPCTYLPQAADVLRFSPWPNQPPRAIDVCNIGRRSPVTHSALVKLAAARRIFYYFDTIAASSGIDRKQRTFSVADPAQHRLLLASLLQRSRYFIANRSRIDEPEHTGGQEEIAGRFYEGAAAGAVMLGEPPNAEQFRSQFGWPDAVIRMPFDCPDVERVLADLDADPQRLARVRHENARQAALQHDWLHRLEVIFKTVGLVPTPAMSQRRRRLEELASSPPQTGR
jgi:Glycosyl transferases group 1